MSDPSDRLARILGRVLIRKPTDDAVLADVLTSAPIGGEAALVVRQAGGLPQVVTVGSTVDISDRLARIVGRVVLRDAVTDATLLSLLADNSANPTAKVPGLMARANAVAPAWTEGNIVPLSSDLAGNTRVWGRAATNTVQVAGGANAGATATLPAAGVGLFHYITHLSIRRVATAALAGGALLTVTTTNLGGRSWRTGNQASITVATFDRGLLMDADFTHPIKSAVANTASTIVGPAAGAAVSWHIVVDYFIGP